MLVYLYTNVAWYIRTLLSIWCYWTCWPFWHCLLLLKWHYFFLGLLISFLLLFSVPIMALLSSDYPYKVVFLPVFCVNITFKYHFILSLSFYSLVINYPVSASQHRMHTVVTWWDFKTLSCTSLTPRDTDLFRLEWSPGISAILVYFNFNFKVILICS